MLLGLDDGALNLRLERGADTLEHPIEGRELANRPLGNLDRDLLEDAEHGALADRAVLALEGVVLREVLDGGLEQRELVGDKGVAVDEVVAVLEVAVARSAVGKIEQRFEVVCLLLVDHRELLDAGVVLQQQALLDHFGDIGAGELHAVGEARLDLGEVVALLLVQLADDAVHLFLRGDHDPGAAPALGRQALGDGLQVGHQLDVVGDVLTDLVDEEVEPEVRPLALDVGVDLGGEVFDRDVILAAVLVENAGGLGLGAAGDLGVGLGDVLALQQGLLPALLPGAAGDALVGRLKGDVEPTAVEIALELGDVALLAVVAGELVEDLDEDRQQGVDLRLADHIGLLVDVEQDALRRDGNGALEVAAQDLVVLTLGQEQLQRRSALDDAVLQQQGDHLQQVRLARAKEAGDPNAVSAGVMQVGVDKGLETLLDLIGQDILFQLQAQAGLVIGLDDAFDGAVDGLLKQRPECPVGVHR